MRRLIAGRERPMKSATAEREGPAAGLMNQRLRKRGTVSTRSLAQSKSGAELIARNNDCMAKAYSWPIALVKYEFGEGAFFDANCSQVSVCTRKEKPPQR